MVNKNISIGIVLFLSFFVSGCQADGMVSDEIDSLKLKNFLQAWGGGKGTYYYPVAKDLNSDGVPETIVYLTGRKWCGSGGCTILILKSEGGRGKL